MYARNGRMDPINEGPISGRRDFRYVEQAQIQNSYFIDNDLEMILRDESLFIDGNFQ